MNIAIDISPLSSGHQVRGVGFYLQHLKEALQKQNVTHTFSFFTNLNEIPSDTDIVHYPYFDPFFLTLPLMRKYKTVVTVHDLTPLLFPKEFPAGLKGNIKWKIQRHAVASVAAIITDSHASKHDIEKFIPIAPNNVHVVYLAAGKEFHPISYSKNTLEQLREKYQLPEKFALYVGDVTANKNLPRLIEAVQRINVPLVMVGKSLVSQNYDKKNPWNADLVKVENLIKNDKNILRLGFVDTTDLVLLYNIATLCVFPSLYEGFGLPVLEAMQSGCPVITSKEGSLNEVAGDSAHIVDAYDVHSIAKGVEKVFSDSSLQKKLSEKGLLQAKKFDWEKTAAETIKIYEKIGY